MCFTFLKVGRAVPGHLLGLSDVNPWTLQKWASREVRWEFSVNILYLELKETPVMIWLFTCLPFSLDQSSGIMWAWSPYSDLYNICWVFPRILGWFVRMALVTGLIVGKGRENLLERSGNCMASVLRGLSQPQPLASWLYHLFQDLRC